MCARFLAACLRTQSPATIALWLALTGDPRATFQADGLLALFGAWSLVMGIINLVPFRTQMGYSDGAQINQWAANGVWADFHRVLGISGATLVTPLRPRNYDIDVIVRASQSITQGPYASTLHLLAYWYFLDQGRIREAGEALTQVTKLYNNTASNVPPGLPRFWCLGLHIFCETRRQRAPGGSVPRMQNPNALIPSFGSPPVHFTGSMVIWMTRIRPCRKPTYSHKSCPTRVHTNLSGIAVPYCAMRLTKCRRLPDEMRCSSTVEKSRSLTMSAVSSMFSATLLHNS